MKIIFINTRPIFELFQETLKSFIVAFVPDQVCNFLQVAKDNISYISSAIQLTYQHGIHVVPSSQSG